MVCFLLLLGNVLYLQVIKADELAVNPLNRRGNTSDTVVRGAILDRSSEVLANSPEKGVREYPYGDVMAFVTGYISETLGSDGTEAKYGQELSGRSMNLSRLGPIAQLFQSDEGNNLKLTIDSELQQIAYDGLDGSKGAVIVLDAETGGILAMVSRPSYDPSTVTDDWQSLMESQNSPLLNRTVQGLYPPGSTMKVLIADAALDEKITDTNEVFECDGKLKIGNSFIKESHDAVHGKVDLKEALTHSCNITFGTLAMRLKGDGLKDAFDRFGFTKALDGQIVDSRPHLPDFGSIGDGDIAQTGIGQGELLVSPLRMAMLASAYINGGNVMKPYLVDEVISPKGTVLFKENQEKWLSVTSSQRASVISSFMENVVENGTGGAAAVSGVKVAGKTGTAENSSGEDHGWFIGTADVNGRKIAFAIIVENSGGGGTVAAPIARQMIVNLRDR